MYEPKDTGQPTLPSKTIYTDELVTDDNLGKKIRDKVPLKYVLFRCRSMIAISALFHSALHIEASEIIDKLSFRDERTLRFSLFTLQKYIKEAQFVIEFLHWTAYESSSASSAQRPAIHSRLKRYLECKT
jgi:hypothetical protein